MWAYSISIVKNIKDGEPGVVEGHETQTNDTEVSDLSHITKIISCQYVGQLNIIERPFTK